MYNNILKWDNKRHSLNTLVMLLLDITILLTAAIVVKQMPSDNTNLLVDSTIALVVATAVLVGATWFYAIQTRDIVNETRNTELNRSEEHDLQVLEPGQIALFHIPIRNLQAQDMIQKKFMITISSIKRP